MSISVLTLFAEAVPTLDLWDQLLGRPVDLIILQDTQATIKICRKGYSPKLRSTIRMFNVNVSSISEVIDLPQVDIIYCHTDFQVADIFTKALAPHKWENALKLLGIDPKTFAGTQVYMADKADIERSSGDDHVSTQVGMCESLAAAAQHWGKRTRRKNLLKYQQQSLSPVSDELKEALRASGQYAVGCAGGAEVMVKTLQCLAEAKPHLVVLELDAENAYNSARVLLASFVYKHMSDREEAEEELYGQRDKQQANDGICAPH